MDDDFQQGLSLSQHNGFICVCHSFRQGLSCSSDNEGCSSDLFAFVTAFDRGFRVHQTMNGVCWTMTVAFVGQGFEDSFYLEKVSRSANSSLLIHKVED